MKRIPVTRGLFTLVDDDIYALYSNYKWNFTLQVKRSIPDGRTVILHRLIMGLDFGDKRVVDHINYDVLDNRRENLRVCTYQENSRYSRSRRGSSSKYKGVTWNREKNRWSVFINRGQGSEWLGNFQDEEEAAIVYDCAARIAFGEFAVLNFPYIRAAQ